MTTIAQTQCHSVDHTKPAWTKAV